MFSNKKLASTSTTGTKKKPVRIVTRVSAVIKPLPILNAYTPKPPILKKRAAIDTVTETPVKKNKINVVESSSSEDEDEDEDDTRSRVNSIEARAALHRNIRNPLDGRVRAISGSDLVKNNRKAYVEYFNDPLNPAAKALEWSGSVEPTITLQYPGNNASETFLLLVPKTKQEEYNPVDDIISIIKLVLNHFLTPAQTLLHFSHITPSNTTFSAFLSAPNSRTATPDLEGTIKSNMDEPFLRTLEKYKSRKDGPGFIRTIEIFNSIIIRLREDGTMGNNIDSMMGMKEEIGDKILSQIYERSVGPAIESLNNYEAFSDNVYGELLPKFVHEIAQKTNLGPNSVFIDLGSGVGNCVLQAALSTGCEAHGFENSVPACRLADAQVLESEMRYRMWGVQSGKAHVLEVDMCNSEEVVSVIKRADVVLVNNEVFSAALNDRLSLLFLDLPTNALIVSLKAFAHGFTLSAYNRDSPLAIIHQGKPLKYGNKFVSWKENGGTWFIGRIERDRVSKWEAKQVLKQEKKMAKLVKLAIGQQQ